MELYRRHNLLKDEKRLVTLAVLVVGLAVILITFRDYGVAWDDWIQSVYGRLVVDYFLSGFHDKSCNNLSDLRTYGPLFEIFSAVLVPTVGEYPLFELRHLLTAVTGLFAVLGVICFGGMLNIRWMPLFSVLALVTMPRFYGHAFINSKDIPFACALIWFMVAWGQLIRKPVITWRRVMVIGFTAGLAAAVRPGSVPLLALFALVPICYLAWTGKLKESWIESGRPTRMFVARFACMVLLAWGLMVLFWPWAHENPVVHPVRAMLETGSFHNVYPVLFEGSVFPSDELPWYYLPKYILITTPLAVLGLAALGIAAAARGRIRSAAGQVKALLWLILAWVLLPVLLVVLLKPNVYDGLRHFLFVLPGLALLAGFGAASLLEILSAGLLRRIVAVCLAMGLLAAVVPIIRLHPYQYCFFNLAAGGLSGAGGRYETDYWVTSYKEAAEWINVRSGSGTGDAAPAVLVAANDLNFACARYFLDSSIRADKIFRNNLGDDQLPRGTDYYLATTRYRLDENYRKEAVVEKFGRDGVTFSVVRQSGQSQAAPLNESVPDNAPVPISHH